MLPGTADKLWQPPDFLTVFLEFAGFCDSMVHQGLVIIRTSLLVWVDMSSILFVYLALLDFFGKILVNAMVRHSSFSLWSDDDRGEIRFRRELACQRVR